MRNTFSIVGSKDKDVRLPIVEMKSGRIRHGDIFSLRCPLGGFRKAVVSPSGGFRKAAGIISFVKSVCPSGGSVRQLVSPSGGFP